MNCEDCGAPLAVGILEYHESNGVRLGHVRCPKCNAKNMAKLRDEYDKRQTEKKEQP